VIPEIAPESVPYGRAEASNMSPSLGNGASRRRRTTAVLLAARLVSAMSTLVVLAVVARTRGIEALGIGALGVVTGTLLATVAEAGTNSLIIREVARDRVGSSGLLGSILLFRVLSLPLTVLLAAPLFVYAFGGNGLLVLLFAVPFVLQQATELARSLLLAVDRPYAASAHGIAENLAWGVAIVGALAAGADLYAAAAGGLGAVLLSAVLGSLMVYRAGVRAGWPTRADLRRGVQLALPFAACSLVTVAALRLDVVLVGILVPSGIAAAGAYFAVARIIASAEYLPETMGRAMYPDLARRAQRAPDSLGEALRPALRDLLALSVPIPFVLAIGGSTLLPLVFGSDLTGYSWILTVLGVGIPMRFMVVLLGVSLSSADAQGRRALITGVALVVGQGLDLLLLPIIGVPAAVLASMVTTLMLLIPYLREVQGRLGMPFGPSDLGVPIGCAVFASLPALGCRAVLGGGDQPIANGVAVGVLGATYLAAMLVIIRVRRSRLG
jgi:O-antigen/teichoic acid export membrane protein